MLSLLKVEAASKGAGVSCTRRRVLHAIFAPWRINEGGASHGRIGCRAEDNVLRVAGSARLSLESLRPVGDGTCDADLLQGRLVSLLQRATGQLRQGV